MMMIHFALAVLIGIGGSNEDDEDRAMLIAMVDDR